MTNQPNILIVEDNLDSLRLLTKILQQENFNVRPAPNGPLALEAIYALPPELIILDIMMPELDGFQVCRTLKQNPKYADIPIIFISALNDLDNKVRAFEVGGVDYITKPYQPAEIIARVKTHLTLRRLQTNLQQKITDLDAFAHTVAHDLQTPVSLIQGYAELALDTTHLDHKNDHIQQILTHTNKMTTIIDSLLLLARIQSDEVQLQPVDMHIVFAEAYQRLEWDLQQANATLNLPDQWPPALGYSPWLEEVWVNYMSNAIKYGGQAPQITIGFDHLPKNMLRYWVKDNGPGIPPEHHPHLFKKFSRVNHKKAAGNGLGLSIVKRIITQLNGTVGVHSQPNKGALFYFTLPQP
ncbi:MAG TPA: hybrid sensor histidine kinase/response regulator [Anaerolineae bacterium]|nr:hybrid sensor histidine kinase/response regulator [Anaerolineae bacterium]